ncbi:hypothetical protein ABZT03_11690 [Streptomyces sp. NPDC005574]|uniref:hypothetical protein n=1 Tax=Streptomyces sp. NPDC005574 TaxID=3156891 RepID=UPI0033B72E6A
MGFKAGVRAITIQFAEGHPYHGAEARVRGMSIGEYMAATGLDGSDGDDAATSMKRFGERLLSWNLDDDDEQPIPATEAGLAQIDQGLARALQNAYVEAIIGVHTGDPLPQTSTSGEPSLVESVPMEALSPSLAS